MNKLRFSVILALLLLLIATLVSCVTPNDPDAPKDPVDDPIVDPIVDPLPKPITEITLKKEEDGFLNATVSRSDYCEGDRYSYQENTAIYLRDKLSDLMDVKIALDTDRAPSQDNSDSIEIIVGMTNHKESISAFSGTYDDAYIRLAGNKIIINGYNEEELKAAADSFFNAVSAAYNSDDGTALIKAENINKVISGNGAFKNLPVMFYNNARFTKFKIGEREEFTDCHELVFNNIKEDAYREYISVLTNAGFSVTAEHTIKNNLFATLDGFDQTVNIGFYGEMREMRLTVEPRASSFGLVYNDYEKVTASQITMIGIGKEDSDPQNDAGLSLVIRTEDGRFVVVDGGYARDNYADLKNIIKVIKEQSADYTDKPVIAAWIFTHTHEDHYSVISSRMSNTPETLLEDAGITVQSIHTNFLRDEKTGRNKVNGYNDVLDVQNFAKAMNAALIRVHAGQIYYFADLKIEVLYTVENHYLQKLSTDVNAEGSDSKNNVYIDFNSTSLISKMTFGNDTTFLCPGDSTGVTIDIANTLYGDYLHTDILQLCHHGYGTKGLDTSMARAYGVINSKLLLWPLGWQGYTKSVPLIPETSFNKAAQNMPDLQETYLAGYKGDIVIVPLPYGSAPVYYSAAENKLK